MFLEVAFVWSEHHVGNRGSGLSHCPNGDHAEAGQIVAADVVRQLAAGKQFLFADLGETELRGFEDPVKLWELRWQDEG